METSTQLVLQPLRNRLLVSQLTTSFHSYSIIIQTYQVHLNYHGQFAHVHVAGKAFYAHAGAWYELVNVGSDLTVGLGTEKYNVGILTASSIKVGTGVTHSSDGDAFVTGISTATKFVGDLSDAVTSRWLLVLLIITHLQVSGGLSSSDDPTIYLARGQTYEFDMKRKWSSIPHTNKFWCLQCK